MYNHKTISLCQLDYSIDWTAVCLISSNRHPCRFLDLVVARGGRQGMPHYIM